MNKTTTFPSSLAPLPTIVPGDILGGGFRVEGRLGVGGMGVVYKVQDVNLERPCALKLLLTSTASNTREMLRREAAALASLRSEHVVHIYGFGEHEGLPYFVMEYVEGRDLMGLIEEFFETHQTPVPLHRGVQILRDLCYGLAAVHRVGMVHRDIKPSNIIVEAHTGRSVIADFGAAVVLGHWDGVVTGTPAYMAPEAFLHAPPSQSVDVYALGCLAFEVFTGRPPYEADSIEGMRALHTSAPTPQLSDLRPELSPFDEVLSGMLAKTPSERLKNPTAISNLLEDRLTLAQGSTTSLPAFSRVDPEGATVKVVSTPPPEEGGLRVLIIDDDPTFARVAARCVQVALSDVRVSVARASSGASAKESIARRRPDLLVLDYMLPDCNGIDLLSQIRARSGGSTGEVIVASGAIGQSEQWRFGILGVQEFVGKPVAFTDLVQVIHRVAARRGWLQATGRA